MVTKVTRNDVVKFIVDEFYDNDVDAAAKATSYTKWQIQNWIDGKNKPQKRNLEWFLHTTFVPEFEIIAEYAGVDAAGETTIRTQISKILKGHEKCSGLYAFYDSMASLIYIGKSDGNLMNECYQQLKAELKQGNLFPSGAKQPKYRYDVVKYVSAYRVNGGDAEDFAKHVESLILRISKPRLNKNIGSLQHAEKPDV
jgi:hypothetical protein